MRKTAVFSAVLMFFTLHSPLFAQKDGAGRKDRGPEGAGARQAQGHGGQKRLNGLISLEIAREHMITDRLLLICEAFAGRLENGAQPAAGTLQQAAELIRGFLEDRQEMQEEKYIFPVFRRNGVGTEVIRVLVEQHLAGRKLMDGIYMKLREEPSAAGSAAIAASLRAFVRMYRPHLACENTAVLPEFRDLVASKEYPAMETDFRADESRRLKEKGVETVMDIIAGLENYLGISDISIFTPAVN